MRATAETVQAEGLDFGTPPETREGRVRFVMRLMAMRLWQKGETGPQLAKAWGYSLVAVEQWAAEASRRVKAAVDTEQVKERLTAALDEALDHARGEPADVAKVATAYADIAGAGAPKRVDIRAVVATLTPEQVKDVPAVRDVMAAVARALAPVQFEAARAAVFAELAKMGGGGGGAPPVPLLEAKEE